MNTPSDPSLRALLRRADPAGGLPGLDPADFSAAVHARISASPVPAHPALRLARHFLPLAAALTFVASLGLGSAVAYARHRSERAELLAQAYATSVDPWLRHASHATSE